MGSAEERVARVGELELAYETFGDAADPAVLMIMGLGAPMIFWPEELCEMLADRGHFVIRFDNRDIGRSTILEEPPPRLDQMLSGELGDVPYRLEDMAADAVGVLDHLGVERAHIVGASLGGMIAQRLAIDRPERVLSLASIMSTTGDRSVGLPTPAALAVLMAPPPSGRDGYVRSFLDARAVIGSKPLDIERTRELAERSFDRGFYPEGTARQLAAILASPDRTEALGAVRAPTVVIHGADDALISVSGGEATAGAIPGSKLVVIPGLNHDLPPSALEPIAAALRENFERAREQALQ